MLRRLIAGAALAMAGLVPLVGHGQADGLDAVNPEWLVSKAEVVDWHREKDRLGPALTGNESWRHYMEFVESQLRSAGVVDLQRNSWSFPRWHTTDWPDDSGWSLFVDGEPVRVMSYGANSGSTGANGIEAPLAYFDPEAPRNDLEGKIVVFRASARPDTVARLAGADYEYRSPYASYPQRGLSAHDGPASQSYGIYAQLREARTFIDAAVAGKAAGAIVVFDAGRARTAGMYSFPVPALYNVPTVYLDREAGRSVIEGARTGAPARLRLQADVVDSTAYQLIGYLPGRHYGTPADEVVQLTTHTDGPSISQDNGALGILAMVKHMSRVPQSERPRTLMVFLDCRHFMPGQEAAFKHEDWFSRRPNERERVVAMVGVEHLGQIEFDEDGDRLVPTGRVDPSSIWVTNNDRMVKLAIKAVIDNGLPSVSVRNVDRPGTHGGDQGPWFGMAKEARQFGIPAFATMGSMGAYWATSSRLDRVDVDLFRRQVATMIQLTGELMSADLRELGLQR